VNIITNKVVSLAKQPSCKKRCVAPKAKVVKLKMAAKNCCDNISMANLIMATQVNLCTVTWPPPFFFHLGF